MGEEPGFVAAQQERSGRRFGGRHAGLACLRNVIDVKTESGPDRQPSEKASHLFVKQQS